MPGHKLNNVYLSLVLLASNGQYTKLYKSVIKAHILEISSQTLKNEYLDLPTMQNFRL